MWYRTRVSPGERELEVVNAREDKTRRGRVAVMIGVSVAVAIFLVRQPSLGGLTGSQGALAVLAGGFALAWWSGLFPRAHAMLRLASIRRDGLAATAKLNVGDFAGAREGFAKLLVTARPLGAFHAVHVLMYGVTRFFEGETKEGLKLASRAIDSGWLSLRNTREVRDAAEAWRVLMLVQEGELAEARRRAQAGPKGALATAAIVVTAHEEKWEALLDEATRALGDEQLPRLSRPTVAVLGAFAAKKLGRNGAVFANCLEKEPLGPLAKANPVLQRFLGPSP